MEHKDARLTSLRSEIDDVNERVLALVQRRAEIVLEIASSSTRWDSRVYDPEREEEMLQHLTARSKGPFGPAEMREIFQAIFRASLDIQDQSWKEQLQVKRRDLVPRAGSAFAAIGRRRRDRGRNARADGGSVLGGDAGADGGDRRASPGSPA